MWDDNDIYSAFISKRRHCPSCGKKRVKLASAEVTAERRGICAECEKRNTYGFCEECMCSIKLKTRTAKEKCPLNLWYR